MIELKFSHEVNVEQVSDYDMMLWYGELVIEENKIFSPDELADEYKTLISSIPSD